MLFDFLSKCLKPLNRFFSILKSVTNLVIYFVEDRNLEFYAIGISEVDLDLKGTKND